MSLDVHTAAINTAGSPPANSDRLAVGLFRDIAFPAAAAALTLLGAITAGTGFTTLPTLTQSGGTLTAGVSPADPAIAIATSLKAVTATIAAPGAGVAINDTFIAAGGVLAQAGAYFNGTTTIPVPTKVTVTHIKVVSAAVNAGGTGGTPGAVTVTGADGTGTPFQATGTINGSGVLTGPLVVTVPGDYTVAPASLAADPVTGGSLTGATVTIVMGALTLAAITAVGGYTVAPPTTNVPTNGVGTGTGVQLTLAFGLGTALLLHSGNYSGAPGFTVTGGGGSGASIAAGTLGGNGNAIPRQVVGVFPQPQGLPTSTSQPGYSLRATLNSQSGFVNNLYKSNLSFSVALNPPTASTTLAAGTFDALTLG